MLSPSQTWLLAKIFIEKFWILWNMLVAMFQGSSGSRLKINSNGFMFLFMTGGRTMSRAPPSLTSLSLRFVKIMISQT